MTRWPRATSFRRMTEDKEDLYEWWKRPIDDDPEFEKAKAVLKEIMAKSQDPASSEERLPIIKEASRHIDSLDLASAALAYWIPDTYDDLLKEKRGRS